MWTAVSALAVAILLAFDIAAAQEPKKVRRVGLLSPSAVDLSKSLALSAFRHRLRELGWAEGKNIVFDHRRAEWGAERFPVLVADLINLGVDVIVAGDRYSTRAAMAQTKKIPIIMIRASDPVGDGFVSSLERPGGNVTGVATVEMDLDAKRLEILKESAPTISHVTLLHARKQPERINSDWIESAAKRLGVKLQIADIEDRNNLTVIFEAVPGGGRGGFVVITSPMMGSRADLLVSLALKYRLPGIYPDAPYVMRGGLMSYGPDRVEAYRRAAIYVDKVLRGAKPAELPVEPATEFELVINLEAARRIDLVIPPDVLMRTDRVIP